MRVTRSVENRKHSNNRLILSFSTILGGLDKTEVHLIYIVDIKAADTKKKRRKST